MRGVCLFRSGIVRCLRRNSVGLESCTVASRQWLPNYVNNLANFKSHKERRNLVALSHEPIAAREGRQVLQPPESGLYVIATPIGCLEDITLRALRLLKTVDVVLCEDTRRTMILLNHYDIHTPLESFHMHNEHKKTPKVLSDMLHGTSIALVSDAGMPAINDPGGQLIAAAVRAGIKVVPVPGPSAAMAAVVASGLFKSTFTFCGFLEAKSNARIQQFDQYKGMESALVFFVSPHALQGALKDACTALGKGRQCCLAREITKIHEEFWRGTLGEALEEFTSRAVRGEFTLVIEGANLKDANNVSDEEVKNLLQKFVEDGMSPSRAADHIAKLYRLPKKQVYNMSLEEFKHFKLNKETL